MHGNDIHISYCPKSISNVLYHSHWLLYECDSAVNEKSRTCNMSICDHHYVGMAVASLYSLKDCSSLAGNGSDGECRVTEMSNMIWNLLAMYNVQCGNEPLRVCKWAFEMLVVLSGLKRMLLLLRHSSFIWSAYTHLLVGTDLCPQLCFCNRNSYVPSMYVGCHGYFTCPLPCNYVCLQSESV